jgi:hypothetical protein
LGIGDKLKKNFDISFVIISGVFLGDNSWDSLYISILCFAFDEFIVNIPYISIEIYSYINDLLLFNLSSTLPEIFSLS